MSKYLIAGNWKMNTTIPEAKELVNNILIHSIKLENKNNNEILFCPPFTHLYPIGEIIKDSNLSLGGQNCLQELGGAFTGEISPSMLNDVGCKYVILGHSERREFFCETNELINKKISIAIENDLIPIYCIGESLEERNNGTTNNKLKVQIKEGLKDIEGNLVIAYEPIWAIGTGLTPTIEQINETHNFIRGLLIELFGSLGKDIKILYGGSLNDKNATDILPIENVNGGLIGGASLNADKFNKIIEIAENT